VFAPEVIDDFIKTALQDLSDYRPKETLVVAIWPLDDPTVFSDMTGVWMVQYRVAYNSNVADVRTTTIPPVGRNSADARGGWDFYGKLLTITPTWQRTMDSIADAPWPIELVVWGYADRTMPLLDDDIVDVTDATDYNCLLTHCKHLGFELLNHDRSLYQQWLAATNNTDVSPTQLSGMTSVAEQSYEKTRRRSTLIRRVPSGSVAYTY